MDDQPPSPTTSSELDLGPEGLAEAVFQRRHVGRSPGSRVPSPAWALLCLGTAEAASQRLSLAHRQAALQDRLEQGLPIGRRRSGQDRPGMPLTDRATRQGVARLRGQAEEPQDVGDRRAVLADALGDGFLGQAMLVDELA